MSDGDPVRDFNIQMILKKMRSVPGQKKQACYMV